MNKEEVLKLAKETTLDLWPGWVYEGRSLPIRKVATLVMLGCAMGLAMLAVDVVMPKPDTRHLLLESRALKAEEDNFELREILAGRLVMIEPIGEMARVAKVEWELVSMEK